MRPPGDKGPLRGRGAVSNQAGRFERLHIEPDPDALAPPERLDTEVRPDRARSVISRNRSPDVPFELSINPYRGCEHGCVYCYARPSHAYLNLSPGLDFETRLFFKQGAAERLREELARPSHVVRPITLGANTDAYQPVERRLRVTRSLLEVLLDCRHPVSIITKSALVERDLDLLTALARQRLVSVIVSVTSLDAELKRTLEPRTASPARRLKTIAAMNEAGVPVGVLIAPVIPVLTDHELEAIVAAAAAAGARSAGYVLLRLPHEVAPLFREWLDTHHPLRAEHVMKRLREARGGRDYDSRYGYRMSGTGVYARLLANRFRLACRRNGLDTERRFELDCSRFRMPGAGEAQLELGLTVT